MVKPIWPSAKTRHPGIQIDEGLLITIYILGNQNSFRKLRNVGYNFSDSSSKFLFGSCTIENYTIYMSIVNFSQLSIVIFICHKAVRPRKVMHTLLKLGLRFFKATMDFFRISKSLPTF